MKKESTSVSTLLGVSQQDLAMLLLVTRSQIAMFESGKRDLPAPAMIRLAEMLTHVSTTEKNAKRGISAAQNQSEQKELERLMNKNEFQQLKVAKELAVASRKLKAQSRVVQLADFLGNQVKGNAPVAIGLLHAKATKASKAIDNKSLTAVVRLQLKQELLAHEKEILESKLKK